MLIPVVIFGVCLCAGVVAGAYWLPDLVDGVVGDLAFFVVCGLLGTALALVGLRTYLIVETVDQIGGGTQGIEKSQVIATGLASMTWEAGSVLALATVVYLLASRPRGIAKEPTTHPTA